MVHAGECKAGMTYGAVINDSRDADAAACDNACMIPGALLRIILMQQRLRNLPGMMQTREASPHKSEQKQQTQAH